MLTNKRAAGIAGRKQSSVVKSETERSSVRAQRIVRHERLCHQVGARRLYTIVDVLSVIAVRPSIETAITHRSHVIRHKIAAKLVAFIHGSPQRTALRLPAEAVRITQAGGEIARFAGGRLDFEYRCAMLFFIDSVFGRVAV